MKMSKKLKMKSLAMQIEYHWYFIMRAKKKAAKDKNTTDSEKRIQSHKNKAFIAQEKYDELVGITATLEEIHWRDVIEA